MAASTKPPLKGDGPFSSEVGFADFLSRSGAAPAAPNVFPARNFLLDENVGSARVESYRTAGAVADHGDDSAWRSAHQSYLADNVNKPHGGSMPAHVDPTGDPDSCPETFHVVDPGSPFCSTDARVDLVRVVEVAFVARCGGVPEAEVQRIGLSLTRSPGAPAMTSDDHDRMSAILASLALGSDLRPVFAGYWQDLMDLFGASPRDDDPAWPDKVRDRFGLSHMDPGTRGPLPILLLRYPVSEVPELRGLRGKRPLVPPSVLDGSLSPPFCPAPRGSMTGAAVDLAGDADPPRREVLHPGIAFEPKHVFRVGTIRNPVSLGELPMVRGLHLVAVRTWSGRAEYAAGTDEDLLK